MQKKPIISKTASRLLQGCKRHSMIKSALTELYFIEHPETPKSAVTLRELNSFIKNHDDKGVWVYYPWRNAAVHTLNEETYLRLRTARNRNLIRPEEQKKYHDSRVAIAGLSVGSSALSVLVATGGPCHIKLADPDILEITNLNRIRGTLLDVGLLKVDIAARAAWEVDPFLDLELWPQGITGDTAEKFLTEPLVDVFIDEMDNIEMKFASRALCKKFGIPVVMATDNGDSIILDVERFDLEPTRPLFHGRVTFSVEEMRDMSRERFVAMANEIIDPVYFTERQQESIMEIGKTLSGVAQLGSAAALAGVAVAYATRRIIIKEDMPSGRYVMGCEPSFITTYNSKTEQKRRAAHTAKFKAAFKR